MRGRAFRENIFLCSVFVLLSLLIVTAGCSSKESGKEATFNTAFNQLQLNMTNDQVQKLLGPPDLREVKPLATTPNPSPMAVYLETWHYNQDEGRQVVFDAGHVVSFGRDGSVTVSPGDAKSQRPTTPQPIGADCKYDSDCQDHNCHFHVCSGKNNCQVPLGGLCAVDTDCCGSHCDFGHCGK